MEDFLTLNIYGENDEIVKTYKTNHIRFKLFKDAVKVNEEIANADIDEQLNAVGGFMKSVFIGLTDEEIENADTFDIFNVFRMIVNKANSIKGGKGKNA